MRDFLIKCFQGTYPHYALISLCVIVFRMVSGRWNKKETLLLFLYAVFFFGLIFQILAVDRQFADMSRRYLVPFAPLLFGFTGWGVVWFYDRLKRPFLYLFLTLLVVAVLLWDSTGPIVKEYYTDMRVAKKAGIEAAGAFILEDYKGEKNRGELPVWWYEPRFPYRPVLKGAPPQLTYKVGGSNWSEFFPDDPVDYLILPADDKTVPDGFVLVFESEAYLVFKPAGEPGALPVEPPAPAADEQPLGQGE